MKEISIIFNCSYFSEKPFGIPIVSQQIAKPLKQENLALCKPFKVSDSKFYKLPKSFYPEYVFKALLRRLICNQFKLKGY